MLIRLINPRSLFYIYLLFILLGFQNSSSQSLDRTGTQWQPFLEWQVENSTYSGSGFDLVATAIFIRPASSDTITSHLFFDSTSTDTTWKLRFSATQTGFWTVETECIDPDLDGLTGTITITENPDSEARGFLKNFASKWGWQGTEQAFTPQLVMHPDPGFFRQDLYPDALDDNIQIFIHEHGFNGFHTGVSVQWFDIEASDWNSLGDNPFPDMRTFEALDSFIVKTHRAGGMVHLWQWADDEAENSITKWGYDSAVSKRLLRYIAARLGPLPGWSMGYGYDNYEWADSAELQFWHDTLSAYMGWPHFLGARSRGPHDETEPVSQLFEGLDYSGYEQYHPPYSEYVRVIDARPEKPAFSEDRFRIRNYIPKDYTEIRTIRGMYHSAFAGGVANIWGNLIPAATDGYGSQPYDSLAMIRRYCEFMNPRFSSDMERAQTLTDGYCLKRPDNEHYLFYKENAAAVQINLSGMDGPHYAIAVDALKDSAYAVRYIGWLQAENQTWTPPYTSDWAIAVGNFGIGSSLGARIYFEGPYSVNNGTMSTSLNSSNAIPLQSPYTEAAREVDAVPGNAVDWVLIQLRQSPSGETIESKSVFLRSDGMLIDANGTTEIPMSIDPGDYYFVIEHRNHMSVMSAQPVRLD